MTKINPSPRATRFAENRINFRTRLNARQYLLKRNHLPGRRSAGATIRETLYGQPNEGNIPSLNYRFRISSEINGPQSFFGNEH